MIAITTVLAVPLHLATPTPGATVTDPDSRVHRHPIGTLAIVAVYGVLFAAGWLLVYVYVYLSRGPVTP